MATQKCPRCGSERIKKGYRPTGILKKAFLRYNLLCDDCNWEFEGFALPGTVPEKTQKKRSNPDKDKKLLNDKDKKLLNNVK